MYPDISQLVQLDRQLELRRHEMIAQADLGCHPLWQVIADPASEPIDLRFTGQPLPFGW